MGRVDWVELGAAGRFVVRSSLFIISIIFVSNWEGRRVFCWSDGGMEEGAMEGGGLIFISLVSSRGVEGRRSRCGGEEERESLVLIKLIINN